MKEVIVMGETILLERTRQLLEEAPLAGQDLDSKVRHLLRTEYLHRLGQYRRADRLLAQKYGMSFDEFLTNQVAREKGYTWDVESDAMGWETAISGMKTIERRLVELHEESHV